MCLDKGVHLITQLDQFADLSDVWEQDLYVLSFVLSEIFVDDPGLRAFVTEIAKCSPSGARFVFIERSGYMWQERMERIAHEAGLELSPFIESSWREWDEDPKCLGDIYDVLSQLGHTPKQNWNVVYSIGIKE